MTFTNFWAKVPQGPADPVLGVTEAFKRDPSDQKINVGVGAYRDEDGKPYVLDSVRKAEDILHQKKSDKEYLPITGLAQFLVLASELAYGKDSKPLQEGRIAVVQSISGTGALRIGFEFIRQFYPGPKNLYLPQPTWGAHASVVEASGLTVKRYRYFDAETIGLDFDGMKEDIEAAEEGSIFLLHACAQNPTGVDPTQEQWREISDIIKRKKHLAFFDMAYQGFASGDVDRDAYAVRYFVEQGHEIMLAQSFAKNLGLYGERAGTFSMVCASVDEKDRVLSQLKRVIRPLYSSPPLHPAQLVTVILSDPELYAEWLTEVKKMSDRINAMRERLYDLLVENQTPGEWGHIKKQIGMFSYTGLTPEQVDAMAKYAHIYMTRDGRISMAGLNEHNIKYFADAMSKAVKGELGLKSSM
ncbi:aspartate transaminase [Trichosporon asahii var. asahii CBS 8904]|uniref:Aspartate aminotransferase n=2 Tax=Trichosporon asahii var. asahii TaxID=189963 RepID=K1V5Y0_TRIAC|nr:aspartate transaminase [Trichosporon asahii var. asahii CBS 2479]EJT48226.1 aspartate transaminase [Trichosporon asahii var. asahii CBS 2479]EKC99414.1 aspartate transaminase [Trichosporon asahii var. asahii CBS 8904]